MGEHVVLHRPLECIPYVGTGVAWSAADESVIGCDHRGVLSRTRDNELVERVPRSGDRRWTSGPLPLDQPRTRVLLGDAVVVQHERIEVFERERGSRLWTAVLEGGGGCHVAGPDLIVAHVTAKDGLVLSVRELATGLERWRLSVSDDASAEVSASVVLGFAQVIAADGALLLSAGSSPGVGSRRALLVTETG